MGQRRRPLKSEAETVVTLPQAREQPGLWQPLQARSEVWTLSFLRCPEGTGLSTP